MKIFLSIIIVASLTANMIQLNQFEKVSVICKDAQIEIRELLVGLRDSQNDTQSAIETIESLLHQRDSLVAAKNIHSPSR